MPTNPGSVGQSGHAATAWNWLAVAVICGGSVVGGIALIEWWWPLFWAGVGLLFAGGVLGWRSNIMAATSEWTPPASRSARDGTDRPNVRPAGDGQ